MTVAGSSEQWYDAEVAPKLLELCKACHERGMSFVASVEYAPGETSETAQLAEGYSMKMLLAYWGIKAHGNIDSLVIAAKKHAAEHGHSSLVLTMLERRT